MSDDFEAITASLGENFEQEAMDRNKIMVVPVASTLQEISEMTQIVNKGREGVL